MRAQTAFYVPVETHHAFGGQSMLVQQQMALLGSRAQTLTSYNHMTQDFDVRSCCRAKVAAAYRAVQVDDLSA